MVSYLLSHSDCRCFIYTAPGTQQVPNNFPTMLFVPNMYEKRKRNFYGRTCHRITGVANRLGNAANYQDNGTEYSALPLTQASRMWKATYSSSSSESYPTGPDSTAMTSLFAWLCFQVLLPVDEGDSFLFFFPKNFLNVLNLDFFFPVQKECMGGLTKPVQDMHEERKQEQACSPLSFTVKDATAGFVDVGDSGRTDSESHGWTRLFDLQWRVSYPLGACLCYIYLPARLFNSNSLMVAETVQVFYFLNLFC